MRYLACRCFLTNPEAFTPAIPPQAPFIDIPARLKSHHTANSATQETIYRDMSHSVLTATTREGWLGRAVSAELRRKMIRNFRRKLSDLRIGTLISNRGSVGTNYKDRTRH